MKHWNINSKLSIQIGGIHELLYISFSLKYQIRKIGRLRLLRTLLLQILVVSFELFQTTSIYLNSMTILKSRYFPRSLKTGTLVELRIAYELLLPQNNNSLAIPFHPIRFQRVSQQPLPTWRLLFPWYRAGSLLLQLS